MIKKYLGSIYLVSNNDFKLAKLIFSVPLFVITSYSSKIIFRQLNKSLVIFG